MEFYWIFAGVLILCFILLFKFLRKTSKRCYVCRESVLSLDALEESRRDAIVNVLNQEGVNLDQLEICPEYSRIYDEGWLSKDWDMSNRYCECGGVLKTPWNIDPPILKKIMTGLPPQIIQSLVEETSREDVAKLLGGIRIYFIDMIDFQKATRYAFVNDVSGSICGCKKTMCRYSNVYIEIFN